MRWLNLTMLVILVLLGGFEAQGQDATNPRQTADDLRAQLQGLSARETELQLRLNELDWELKPENIERYFSGVGSTRPEQLRELRRRQLQTEKDGIVLEQQQLASRKTQLEAGIVAADAQAQAAQLGLMGTATMVARGVWGGHKTVVVIGAILVGAIVGIIVLAVVTRKQEG